MGIRFRVVKKKKPMNEKMLTDLKDVRINMTSEMKDLVVKLLVIKQTLENEKLSLRDKRILKREFDKLLKSFIKEFQANNQVQVQIVRTYLGINKKIRDKQVIN